MIDVIQKLLEPLTGRINMMIGRAIITALDDEKFLKTAQLKLSKRETRDEVHVLQAYGFTSNPLPGAEAIAIFPGGNRSAGIVVGTEDRRYRLKGLAGGEVALFDCFGNKVHLKKDGSVNITGASKVTVTAPEVDIVASSKVSVTSPTVELSGDLSVAGDISAGGSVAAIAAVTAASMSATGAIAAASVAAAAVTAGGIPVAAVISAFDAHTHVAPPTGGVTSPPTPTV